MLGTVILTSVVYLTVALDVDTCQDACLCRESNVTNVDLYTTTELVHDEYIVQFKAYYTIEARHGFVNAALKRFKDWELVIRHNPAYEYPSDFDLLRLYDKQNSSIASLKKHPMVVNVRPNLKVKRHLQSLEQDDYYGAEFNSRHKLSSTSASSFWDTVKFKGRGLKRTVPRQITAALEAESLWQLGYTGKGVKVAIFDTGLAEDHPHFLPGRIKDRTDWTEEKSKNDKIGHGTFVAGIIASSRECLGFAKDADLYIFRVFTDNQVSYTSWFLDAFNYAILKKINVLNLSIGGPDFMDHPFVDKVRHTGAVNTSVSYSAVFNPFLCLLHRFGNSVPTESSWCLLLAMTVRSTERSTTLPTRWTPLELEASTTRTRSPNSPPEVRMLH